MFFGFLHIIAKGWCWELLSYKNKSEQLPSPIEEIFLMEILDDGGEKNCNNLRMMEIMEGESWTRIPNILE